MNSDDATLLRACLEGRRAAWDELVDRYSPYIYFLINATFRKHHRAFDNDDVEELHSSVFLALMEDDMRRLRMFRGENGCTLRSWLRILTINRTIDFLKSLRPTTSLDAEGPEGLRLVDLLEDPAPGADELLEQMEAPDAREVIAAVVQELSPSDHTLFELLFMQGLSTAVAAEQLGLSKGAVYTRKTRMLDRMSRTAHRLGYLGNAEGRSGV